MERNSQKTKEYKVDQNDVPLINQFTWYLNPDGYWSSGRNEEGKTKHYLMHRLIMNCPKGLEVDHINGDKLDNRRSNLRICTRQQNARNITVKKQNATSVYRGVSLNRQQGGRYNYWFAAIKLNGKAMAIGTFKSELHAAMAYDIAAKELFGEYANLNFKST